VFGVGIFIMSNEIEIWKDVIGYEGLYQISSFGNVKSLIFGKERILKAGNNGKGYLQVVFQKNSKSKSFKVHVLVAMCFLGHKPDGTHKVVVDHIDNNRLNNHLNNLRLTNNRDNTTKDRKVGTSKYIGVHFDKKRGKWVAVIYFKDRAIHLGRFESEVNANFAYKKALKDIEQGLDLNILYPKWRNIKNKYQGVYFHKSTNRWEAYFGKKYLGSFTSELEAYQTRENYIKNKIK
jgi:hypothetical protein